MYKILAMMLLFALFGANCFVNCVEKESNFMIEKKLVVITGVTKGIGLALVEEFTRSGWRIASWHPVPHYQMGALYERSFGDKEMNETPYHLEYHDTIPKEYEEILYQGISEAAFHAKGLSPIRPFSIFIKDQNGRIFGGASGTLFYGSLYVDSLWIDKTLRHQGWGTRLMHEAENIGRKHGVSFITLNTMDWEALPFYQKLGYCIEFVPDGYDKNSKMFFLRKKLF